MAQNPNQPFSEYLTAPAQPQTPHPTGMESPGIAAALIGKNFLDGLRQGRLQRAAQVEHENEKTQRSAETALHYLDTLKDVDPEVIGPYKNRIMQQYLQMIGSQKESSKDTGHPMTDMLKNMAINLSGGPMPKQKGSVIDPNLINEAMMAAVDPNNSKYNRMGKIATDIAHLSKQVGVGDLRTAMGHEQITPMLAQYRRLAGDPDAIPDSLKSLPADPFGAAMEKMRLSEINGVSQTPFKSSGNIANDASMLLNQMQRRKALNVPNFNVEPTIGKNQNYIIPGGASNVPVMGIEYRNVPGWQDGVYDKFGKIIEGAVLGSSYNPNTATQVIQASTTQGAPAQYLRVDRNTGKAEPVLINGNPLYNWPENKSAIRQTTDDATGAVYDWRETWNPASLPKSQPVPIAPTQPNPTASVVPTQVNTAVPAQVKTAAPPVTNQSGVRPTPQASGVASQPVPTTQTPIQSAVPKGNLRKAGVDQKWLEDRMKNVKEGTESEEDILKQAGGNPNNVAVLRKALGKNNLTFLNKQQIDNVNSVARMALITPLYKELAALLPNEKNQTLQFVKGQIVNKTGAWTNPKVNDLVGRINTELSNIAKGIAGEVRPTDADAQRMGGYSPQATYNLDINQDRIKHFENILKNELKRHAGGASDEQLEAMIAKRNPSLQGMFRTNPFRDRAKK